MRRWPSLEWRFWPYVLPVESGCWEWQAGKTGSGYGKVHAKEYGEVSAHRVAYAMMIGDPVGLHVLHRCDNPICVNPAHLWLGTHLDNMRDMAAKKRQHRHWYRAKTHCKRGHLFDEANTYHEKGRVHRKCRVCATINRTKQAWEADAA